MIPYIILQSIYYYNIIYITSLFNFDIEFDNISLLNDIILIFLLLKFFFKGMNISRWLLKIRGDEGMIRNNICGYKSLNEMSVNNSCCILSSSVCTNRPCSYFIMADSEKVSEIKERVTTIDYICDLRILREIRKKLII